MGRKVFVAQSIINAPAEEVFRWHAEPGALERLTPPWEPLEVLERAPGVRNGDRGVLRVRVGPFRVRWEFEHCDYVEGRQFRDVQIRGPFRRWSHTHRMTPEGPKSCRLEDHIEYELPLGICWQSSRELVRAQETAETFSLSAQCHGRGDGRRGGKNK